jgi:hypothetical protein
LIPPAPVRDQGCDLFARVPAIEVAKHLARRLPQGRPFSRRLVTRGPRSARRRA